MVFAAFCCERLLPFYSAFFKMENWGDPDVLRNALDKIWTITRAEQFSNEIISELSQKCAELAPDSDDFFSPYTFQAQNACAAICYSLDFYQMKEISFLVAIARDSYDSVEMYLQVVNDPILDEHLADSQFDKWIETAPLLIAEIKYQQKTIKLLSEKKLDDLLIEKIRLLSARSGVQPEKRGIL